MPQHNGISERRNRILLNMVRSMMDFSSPSIFFQGYALESACYVLNKVPSKSMNKLPYEIWTGHKSVLSYLRIWGCPAYIRHLKIDKLRSRSDKCIFMGYPKETKGYYFYLADEQKIFISNKAHFLEKKFFSKGISASKIEFDKVRRVEKPTQSSESTELDCIESNPKSIIDVPLRRSDRVSHPLD